MRYRTYGRMTGRGRPVTVTGNDRVMATLQTREGGLTLYLEGNGDYALEAHPSEMNAPHQMGAVVAEGNVHERVIRKTVGRGDRW